MENNKTSEIIEETKEESEEEKLYNEINQLEQNLYDTAVIFCYFTFKYK